MVWGAIVLLLQAAGAVPAVQAPCELHIWPAPTISSVTQGWMLNNVVDQDFAAGRAARPELLTAAGQGALLGRLDVPALLDVPGAKVIVHDAALGTEAPGVSPARHADSAAACYAELVVRKIVFARDPLSGGALQSLIEQSRFAGAGPPTRRFTTWTSTRLVHYPARGAAEAATAQAELADAYLANVRSFAGYASGGDGKRRRKR